METAEIRRRWLAFFEGKGHQVRDCLHPRDLLPALARQLAAPKLAIVKPGNIAATSASTAALMTKRNNPSVMSVAGSVIVC